MPIVLLVMITVTGVIAASVFVAHSLYTIARWPSANATVLRYRKVRGSEGIFYHPVVNDG